MEKSRSQTGERLFSARRKRLSCLRRAIPGKFRFGLIWEVGEAVCAAHESGFASTMNACHRGTRRRDVGHPLGCFLFRELEAASLRE